MTKSEIQREELATEKNFQHAKNCIENGQLICFPTETVYALAASPTNEDAINHLYALKGRDPSKPFSLLTFSLEQAQKIAVFNPPAMRLAQQFFPGPLTLVLPLRTDVVLSKQINNGGNTIGIRIPSHPIALQLLSFLNTPLVATSVNYSGEKSAVSISDIPEDFKTQISWIMDGGTSPLGLGSTVVDMCGNLPYILRQGTITHAQISEALSDKKL